MPSAGSQASGCFLVFRPTARCHSVPSPGPLPPCLTASSLSQDKQQPLSSPVPSLPTLQGAAAQKSVQPLCFIRILQKLPFPLKEKPKVLHRDISWPALAMAPPRFLPSCSQSSLLGPAALLPPGASPPPPIFSTWNIALHVSTQLMPSLVLGLCLEVI